jgi:FtsZ-binding cell division protein ZapB/SepF-like predicted cell division protein (DUF552 family)
MKKNYFVNTFIAVIILCIFSSAFAQSDYETVQNFKKEYKELEQAIKDADSLAQLDDVLTRINQLRGKYELDRDLLDKSLYPDNFSRSFEKLNTAFLTRQKDFSTIDVLHTEVSELKIQVEDLNQKNDELLSQVEDLEARSLKDKKSIARLEGLVADLRSSLRKRDNLVLAMIDSLMPPTSREKTILSEAEKKEVVSEEKEQNVLDNVRTTIDGNIRFLDVTSLKPDDLVQIREQQRDFAEKWQKVGTKLVEVYSTDKEKSNRLQEIETLFGKWNAAIRNEAWQSIKEEFATRGIQLNDFSDGDEFESSIAAFADNEVKNIGVKNEEDSKKTYNNFADSTWFAVIEPVWIPYLTEYKMISDKNKTDISNKISTWKGEIYPSTWWIYLIIAVVVLLVIIFFITRRRKPGEQKLHEPALE